MRRSSQLRGGSSGQTINGRGLRATRRPGSGWSRPWVTPSSPSTSCSPCFTGGEKVGAQRSEGSEEEPDALEEAARRESPLPLSLSKFDLPLPVESGRVDGIQFCDGLGFLIIVLCIAYFGVIYYALLKPLGSQFVGRLAQKASPCTANR